MDKLVTRLKAEKSRNAAEIANQIEEQRQRLVEEENLRVERLKKMIPNWLKVMSAAGYPHVELLTLRSQEIKKGLFGSRVETHEEEAAGWRIGGEGAFDEGGVWYGIEILLIADGRLGRILGEEHKGGPYQLGTGFGTEVDWTGHTRVCPSYSHVAEEKIPGKLKAIAEKAGLDWNPDEVAPSP